jgi:hypothetical protein
MYINVVEDGLVEFNVIGDPPDVVLTLICVEEVTSTI